MHIYVSNECFCQKKKIPEEERGEAAPRSELTSEQVNTIQLYYLLQISIVYFVI